jgi:hypothetical protein
VRVYYLIRPLCGHPLHLVEFFNPWNKGAEKGLSKRGVAPLADALLTGRKGKRIGKNPLVSP